MTRTFWLGWILLTAVACGGETAPDQPKDPIPDAPEDPTNPPDDPDDPPPPPPATYALTVEGGFGSGSYAAGDTVHVWADVDTGSEILTGWAGDTEVLDVANEWHTVLVMPAADVVVTAEIESVDVTLTVATVTGRDRDKTVRYFVPQNPRGVVAVLHGTNGSSRFIEKTEPSYVVRRLVHAGFAVFATDAEEVDAGDTDDNGGIQWDAVPTGNNVDLANLTLIYDRLESQGLVPASTPRFVFGMSNGGAMAVTVGAMLNVEAAISYCSSGLTPVAAATETPTAWFMCEHDQNNPANIDKATTHHQDLVARSIPTELVLHPASPLYSERFTRVASIDAVTSATLVSELDAQGLLSPDGFVEVFRAELTQTLTGNPDAFPTWASLSNPDANAALDQISIVTADHKFYDDLAARTVAFFDAAIE